MNKQGDRLACWLIQRAASKAPASLAERLEEEWLADLAARNSSLARLRLAVGCCWATKVIAQEFAAPKVLAASSSTGSETMTSYLQHDFSIFSRRTTTVVVIVGLHVALISVFASGLARGVIRVIPEVFTGDVVPGVKPPPLPPLPPPEPRFEHRHVSIPDPVIPFPVPTGDDAIQQPSTPHSDTSTFLTPTPTEVQRVLGGPGRAFPNTNDFYPPETIRRGETGAVTVQSCVDEKGRLTGQPSVVQTSGFAGLDAAALRLAKAGSGHYRPTTEDGHPVSSCFDFRVRFDLRD